MSESWAEAEDMLQNLRRRDGRCWVTKVGGPTTTSHILPKRAGDAQARFIYGDFTDKPAHAWLSVHHPEFGFLLTPNLEYWFDNYLVGFRHIGNVSILALSFELPISLGYITRMSTQCTTLLGTGSVPMAGVWVFGPPSGPMARSPWYHNRTSRPKLSRQSPSWSLPMALSARPPQNLRE
ncbi:hypothetical protein F5880DRAFT_951113 [Lentinula raphanica]|nr:hypothetical protein F5880DRAFT_951113 [Lentinula raphanica]